MFQKIKDRLDSVKIDVEVALEAVEKGLVEADDELVAHLQGFKPVLEAAIVKLDEKIKKAETAETPAPVAAPPEEPAQEAKGDASEPAPEVQQ